jgi:hypothetical protein
MFRSVLVWLGRDILDLLHILRAVLETLRE